jgi:transcriptional regulator with XRE-family HTH domain
MQEDTENDDSPQARAIRLKKIRQLMALTTEDLAKVLRYTRQTISHWENAETEGGLSEKGAIRLAEAARQKGIRCDAQWLLYGITDAKTLSPLQEQTENNQLMEVRGWMKTSVAKLQCHLKFFREIASFLLDDPTAVIAEIQDASMEPVYEKGDWVGGQLTTVGAALARKICIVEMDESPEVRMVQLGDAPDRFHLTYLKKTPETEARFELKNVSIVRAANIVRLWRR